jgi:K+/H+ antiporter YhaU regulatory subunit KhtT
MNIKWMKNISKNVQMKTISKSNIGMVTRTQYARKIKNTKKECKKRCGKNITYDLV